MDKKGISNFRLHLKVCFRTPRWRHECQGPVHHVIWYTLRHSGWCSWLVISLLLWIVLFIVAWGNDRAAHKSTTPGYPIAARQRPADASRF